MSDVYAKLLEIQRELKCEKNQYNKFGGYQYRTKEGILEAAKPLAHERGCSIVVNDEVVYYPNGWMYIESTAELHDCESGSGVTAKAQAREPESKKGMDASQITGTAASYAGKRALGNLFAIDDTKDADSLNDHKDDEKPKSEPKSKPKSGPKPEPDKQNFKTAISAAFVDARAAAVAANIGEDAFKEEWVTWLHSEFDGKPASDFTKSEIDRCNAWLREWAESHTQG